jgi:predicted transcriptional regulator
MITVDNVLIPNITQKGIKFIQNGGYKKERERMEMQDEMVLTTIESNKRSKSAIIISILSLVLSAAAIIIGFFC